MPVERESPPAARAPSRTSPRPSAPRPAVTRPAVPLVRGLRVLPLVLWPALVTLAVTLLRLAGELRGWSPEYWSRLPGGGLSPLGITWLAPLVGAYFGWRLGRAGLKAPHPVVTVGVPLVAAAAGALAAALAGRLFRTSWTANFAVWAAASVLVAAAAFAAWPALGRLLLAYAYAARLPVAAVMAVAITRHWGTHYDVPPPGFPPLPFWPRWLWTALVPQATIWVAWTMVTGAVLASVGHRAAGFRRR